jgi:3-oxoacid CoA-transferase
MKILPQLSPQTAAELVNHGSTIMVGGFGMTGNPVTLVHALADTGVSGLTYIGNNVGEVGLGGGRLLRNGQIKKIIGSFFTSNPEAVSAAQSGEVEFELLPQGSLVEAIRAGGAGIAGFYTLTGAGTVLGNNTDVRTFAGRPHVFVHALQADVALVRAWQADEAGNLAYRMTERNFNPIMATAADLVIVEAETIVPVGSIDPDNIHTPGCYVDVLVEAKSSPELLGTSGAPTSPAKETNNPRTKIAERALRELNPGDVVNLGVGIPTLIADLIGPSRSIVLHTENGMLGVGPKPKNGGAMNYPVNASKVPVTAQPGSSYFDSAGSFAMIRGGHVDIAVMGGLQVDESGNLANWAVPGKPLLGVGGGMDLASGAKRLIVTMQHIGPDGSPKIVPKCTLPLTAQAVVDLIITDLAVFSFESGKITLIELMPGVTLDKVRALTSATFEENIGANQL